MPCTVASIRAELTPEQNAKYKDYRIERWITYKKGNQVEVLRHIASQSVNEDRLAAILSDPERKKATMDELGRRVMSITHIPSKHDVMLYLNTRNQNPKFNEQEATDALLLCMHYLVHRIEELEGEGKTAVCVIDMMSAATPHMNELEGQMRMFSGVMGRSFPGTFSQTYLCCSWNIVARKTVSTLARGVGIQAEFVGPSDIMARVGKAATPTVIGGDLNLDALQPIDTAISEFLSSAAGKAAVAPPMAAPGKPCQYKWSSITTRSLKMQPLVPTGPALGVDYLPEVAAAACSLLALFLGQYLSIVLIAAALVYSKFVKGGASKCEGDATPEEQMLRYILDSTYLECAEIMQSPAGLINFQDLNPNNPRKLETAALTLTACLRSSQKDRLKRCFKTALDITSMVTSSASNLECIAKWQRLFNYVAAADSLQANCICGCQGRGNLDWFDEHFDDSNRSTLVSALLFRRSSNTPGDTQRQPQSGPTRSPVRNILPMTSPTAIRRLHSDPEAVRTQAPRQSPRQLSPDTTDKQRWRTLKDEWGQRREEWGQWRMDITHRHRHDDRDSPVPNSIPCDLPREESGSPRPQPKGRRQMLMEDIRDELREQKRRFKSPIQ